MSKIDNSSINLPVKASSNLVPCTFLLILHEKNKIFEKTVPYSFLPVNLCSNLVSLT